MYTNNSTEELKNMKGFTFITNQKYEELASVPITLRVQIKELEQKLKRSEKKLEKSDELIKSLQNSTATSYLSENNLEVSKDESKPESDRKIGSDRQIPAQEKGIENNLSPEIENLKNQVGALQSAIANKSKELTENNEIKEILLKQLTDTEANLKEKLNQTESLLKQEILKKEQIEKDLNKLEIKYNEVQKYMREEVERNTDLISKNELLDAKYRKVKTALKEMANKLKERESEKLTKQISEEATLGFEALKVELLSKNEQISNLNTESCELTEQIQN